MYSFIGLAVGIVLAGIAAVKVGPFCKKAEIEKIFFLYKSGIIAALVGLGVFVIAFVPAMILAGVYQNDGVAAITLLAISMLGLCVALVLGIPGCYIDGFLGKLYMGNDTPQQVREKHIFKDMRKAYSHHQPIIDPRIGDARFPEVNERAATRGDEKAIAFMASIAPHKDML
jgi:hypothetical protein